MILSRLGRFKSIFSSYQRRRISNLSSLVQNNEISDEYINLIPQPEDEIVIAMSSGVDSSVTASIYASKFPKVRGIYMANWSQTARCTEEDWNDVQRVCKQLKIPCERVNFEKEYWGDVFQPMIQLYRKGLTPNPDVGCNRYVKFGKMIEHLTKKFDNNSNWWLATGHYARVMKHVPTGNFQLLRSFYAQKDQSFYLSSVPKEVLPKLLMPIGHLTKPEVREIADSLHLYTAKKPDSQGLCFVSQDENNFKEFLNNYIEPNPGNIITEDGRVWGTHDGLWQATIGQKAGISMPQGDPLYMGTWFISEKRIPSNELVIVKGNNNEKLYKRGLVIEDWIWLINEYEPALEETNLTIQFRSLQTPNAVKSIQMNGTNLIIELEEMARAMAPGQNVVLYKGTQVLGSGILKETFN
ncbi:uncharacterized protein PRCAT00004054001 [Priceomyces carsonii]|uniref:uncharacterized protein n=1 Tax=Priceomyces carsonii TaxID=28549 RepID=UPI002EDB57BA|nr:unnamed protein product [Priceomyces carsonii]